MTSARIPDDAVRETWESVYEQSLKLAQKIENHCRNTGEQFDKMLVVPRGGYYPANIISRELNFGATDILHASLSSYALAGASKRQQFQYGQMPSVAQVHGHNILIIEEVCDTGHTLNELVKFLRKSGAGIVRTGALCYKPSRSETGYEPDWYIFETDKWVVYPWEVNEANGKKSRVKRKRQRRL